VVATIMKSFLGAGKGDRPPFAPTHIDQEKEVTEVYSERNHRGGRWLVAGALIVAIGLVCLVWQGAVGQDRSSAADSAVITQAKSLSVAFRTAAKRVLPTVVTITSTTKPKRITSVPRGRMPRVNPFEGTPFEDFFRGDHFGQGIPRRHGVGSGVIIDPTGVILTNNHVVEGADEVTVELADGREFTAVDIKTDDRSDLAVLRIEASGSLPAAAMGSSEALEIGDWVLAIGNPFNLDGTVSAGIISGKGRSLEAGKRTNFLQTDAAINPGNSGGPLVNLDGEVVGINTAIASSTGGYQGVGFAIPIDLAKWVTGQLVQHGSVQRAYLGVQIREIDNGLAEKFGVAPSKGVLVMEVYPKTPAAAAGFEVGDVIVAFAGHPVGNPRQLQALVERSAAGSKQKVDVVRNGGSKALYVVVKPMPGDFDVAAGRSPQGFGRGNGGSEFQSDDLGLEVGEMTEELAARLGLEGYAGVLITGVDPDGIAASAGLTPGMLIRSVERKPVESVAEFKAAVKDKSLAEGILLMVRTPEGNMFLVLKSS